MDYINDFSKGLNTDNSELNQPQGTYRYMLNGVCISNEGDIFNPTNEKGTTNRVTTFPTGFKIIGGTVLNTDLIVLLVNPSTGASQIGIIDNGFVYTRKAPSNNAGTQLGLTITNQVECQARKLITGERIIYFVDNNRPMGFLNLDNPPADSVLESQSKLIPDQMLTNIDLVEIEESSGSLRPGVVQFITRYKSASLNSTSFGIPSNPIPIIDNKRVEGRNAFDGEYYDYGTIAKTVKLTISNIDINYPFLEVVVIYYDNTTNTFTAEALPLVNITSTTQQFSYNGEEQNTTPLTQAELAQLPISYDTAKCIEQKDDMLLISNLRDSNSLYDTELQNIANGIRVKYKTEEIEFLDGTTSFTSLAFNIVGVPYIIVSPASEVFILFNDTVDVGIATTLANYDLELGASNWTPTAAIIDPGNDRLVKLTFAIATIDSTYTLEILNAANYTGTATYNSGGSHLALTVGQPIGQDPLATTNGFQFNDYKNEHLTFAQKGYQRDEIYSLFMGVAWNDGTFSFGYPIAASNALYRSLANLAAIVATPTIINSIPDTPGVYSGNTTGELGVYRSTIDYPTTQNLPISIDSKIRHHKMPSLKQEPHFRYDAVSGRTYIRILGLEFKYTVIPSAGLSSRIQSVVFYRQRRNTSGNRSIITQGMVSRFTQVANDYTYNTGAAIAGSLVYRKLPFFDAGIVSQTNVVNPPGIVGSRLSAALSYAYNGATGATDTQFAFFSPESLFNRITSNEVIGAKIRSVLKVSGRVSSELIRKSKNRQINNVAYIEFVLKDFPQMFLFNNYYKEDNSLTPAEVSITNSSYIDKGNTQTIDTIKIDNTFSSKFLYLKTQAAITDLGLSNTITYNIKASFSMGSGVTSDNDDTTTVSSAVDYNNNLFNIYSVNTQQYGSISSVECIPIYKTDTIPTVINEVTPTIYGGDIFISKFAYVNKDLYKYRGIYDKVILGVGTANWFNDNAAEIIPVGDGSGKGFDARALSYFFVESTINCNYRHQFQDRTGASVVAGVKYYPKDSAFTVLSEDPRNGDSDSYNTQYSFENTVKPVYTKSISYSSLGRFENRTIYSERARQDDLVDNYRIFLQNSIHDIPKHTGEICNTFVHNNTFYIHTPKSLWRAFVNEISTQATSIGEVIQGTGGIFSMPSKEVVTSTGGYAGTISQFGGVHTPFGYIFPDALQGKVFMLSQGLEEISQNGMMQYFDNNLSNSLITTVSPYYVDNPSNPASAGIVGVYDYESKRYIIVKRGTATDFTLSYSLLNKSWISYHSYKPNFMISINDRLFGFDNSGATVIMHEHNVGNRGVYYGAAIQAFILKYVVNPNQSLSKVFNNIFIQSKAESSVGAFLDLEIFNTIRCTNYNKDTGIVTLLCTNAFDDNSNVKKKKDQFQLAVPRNSLSTIPNFPDKMKGKFMTVELTYNNAANNKLLVNFITSLYEEIAR